MLSKLSDNKLKYIKQCLEDLKKYPDSIRIMENFLYACVDYGLQNLSSEQEISTVFADCTIRLMKAPNEQKTGRIGFYPMKLPL